MTTRSIAGVFLGLALWWFLFFAIGIGIGFLSSDYREAARLMFQENDMSGYGTPQLFLNYVLFVIAGVVVGGVATLIDKGRAAALALTALFLLYMVINHYVMNWDQFPAWYNLIVPVVVAGSIYSGHLLMRSSGRKE
jgi:hypothetical protein